MEDGSKAPLSLQELKNRLDGWRATIREMADAADADLIASNEAIIARLRANRECLKELGFDDVIRELLPTFLAWPGLAHSSPELFATNLPEGLEYIGGKIDEWHAARYVRNDFVLLSRKYSLRISSNARSGRIELLERAGDDVRTVLTSTISQGGRGPLGHWALGEVTQLILGDWVPTLIYLLELIQAKERTRQRELEAARLRKLMDGGF